MFLTRHTSKFLMFKPLNYSNHLKSDFKRGKKMVTSTTTTITTFTKLQTSFFDLKT